MEIAIYGKGGIGKSTLSANISVALSGYGKKILQIGCDPKHDSTRLIMHGEKITTMLDYIRDTAPVNCHIKDVLFHGYNGIGCVEAGGPKPGVGCAGRGIITAFELLDRFDVKNNYDIVLYDVLGDVVCGGFAVPIRSQYADTIYLVTSGEYMSLYAANNILKGIENYDGKTKKRVAGILFNSRNVDGERNRVKSFANAVNLPICAEIPRKDSFARAEALKMTVLEYGDREIETIFNNLAEEIINSPKLYFASPLADDDLETLILNAHNLYVKHASSKDEENKNLSIPKSQKIQNAEIYLKELCTSEEPTSGIEEDVLLTSNNNLMSKSIIHDEPLHGCAFNGAMSMSINIKDMIVIAHGPKNCAHLSYQSISSSGRRPLYERGTLLPAPLAPNIWSTDMDEGHMIFGGMDKLRETVSEALERGPKAILIVSTCPAGIIGDDIDKVRDMGTSRTPVYTLKTDGNLAGDYLQGMLMAYTDLAKQIIDENISPQKNLVNIIFEKVISKNTQLNFDTISGYLKHMGVSVNCRFLCNTTYEKIKNFKAAELNMLAYDDFTGRILKEFFKSNYDSKFFELPFPIGFTQTCEWLRKAGKYFEQERIAEAIILSESLAYDKEIKSIKKILSGKTLLIVTFNHNLDWFLEAAFKVGIKVLKIGVLNFSQDDEFRSNLNVDLPIELNYERQKKTEDIISLKPDIVLSNYDSGEPGEYFSDTIPMCPDTGFFSALTMLRKWSTLIDMNLKGEWVNDKEIYDQHNSR
ncbi:nitrogenase component 1 [Eubacteriales bacterium KG127]